MEKELIDITKKSGTVFFGGLVSNVLSLIFNLIVVRIIGVKEYGEFTYVFTFLSLLPIIGALALNKGLTYALPRFSNEGRTKEMMGLIGFCLLTVSFFSVILAAVVYWKSDFISMHWLNKPNISELLRSLIPLSIPLALITVLNGVFVGTGKINALVTIQNIYGPVIRMISLLIFVFLGYKILGLVAATYISTICGLVLFLGSMLSWGFLGGISLQQVDEFKRIFLFSLPLLIAVIVATVGTKINIFMIGYYLNAEQVGVYNIATKVSGMSAIIMMIISSMFAPVISSLYHRGEIGKLGSLFKVTTKWMVAGNLIVLSLVLLFSVEIMRIFGSGFTYGSTVLLVLTLGQVINAGTGAAGSINIMTGHSSYELYTNTIVLCLIILMNYWLIPLYGIIGAAFTFAVAIGITNIIRVMLVYRDHRIHPYSWDYIKVIGACTLSFGLVWSLKVLVNVNWLIEMIALSCVYLVIFAALSFAFGISKDDRFVLEKIIQKLYRRDKGKLEISTR